jgi:hypothetical protein
MCCGWANHGLPALEVSGGVTELNTGLNSTGRSL